MKGLSLVDRCLGVFDNKDARDLAKNLAKSGLKVRRRYDDLSDPGYYVSLPNELSCEVIISNLRFSPPVLRTLEYNGTPNPALFESVDRVYQRQFGSLPVAYIGDDNYNRLCEPDNTSRW